MVMSVVDFLNYTSFFNSTILTMHGVQYLPNNRWCEVIATDIEIQFVISMPEVTVGSQKHHKCGNKTISQGYVDERCWNCRCKDRPGSETTQLIRPCFVEYLPSSDNRVFHLDTIRWQIFLSRWKSLSWGVAGVILNKENWGPSRVILG